MPLPLKTGYHFNFDRTVRPSYYEMSSAEAYTDFYGISFMISGERLIYSPNFTTIVQAGEIVFIPKNIYRRTTYISNKPYERILLKFTDSMISDLIKVIGQKTFDDLCKEHVIRLTPSTQKKVLGILTEMEQEWKHYNEYSELLLKGLLNKLIIICLRERVLVKDNDINLEKKHTYLLEAIQYIKTHLRDNPSLNETAESIHISPSYLSKLFVNQLHTPYSVFVRNEKLLHAQKLLAETRLSITEIAAEAGFASNAYFSDCFKRMEGISPLQFRKAAGKLTP
ncbi:MAG: AraC family transcriptional regulator [Thermoflexaceae bacterium]|nr:AraC family transcriptional regulator [Thermoflexaceae bacterium]